MPPVLPEYKLTEGNSVLLDLLRGLSAQAVLIGHALYFNGFLGPDTSPDVFIVQGYAVLIFFILSGFLITYSTANKLRSGRKYGFQSFFIDRFSRIYTGFIPALLFVLVVDTLHRSWYPDAYTFANGFTLRNFVGNLFLLQDTPMTALLPGGFINNFGSGDPFWTVAVEWYIYLFFGWAVLRLIPARGNGFLNFAVFLPLLIVPAFHLWGGDGNGLMMTWVMGAVAYLLSAHGYLKDMDRKAIWLLLGFIGAVAVVRFLKTGEEYDPVLAFLSTAAITLLIELCRTFTWPGWLRWSIRSLAAYSFTLYLVHYTILDLLRSAVGTTLTPEILLLVGCVLSNVVAAFMGYYIEVLLTPKVRRRLKDQFNGG